MAKTKEELREARKQKLPTVTAFSPRDSLSNLLRPSGGKRQSRASSPLDLPKEFFLLLRQYEEEMLDAFLQEDDYSRNCFIIATSYMRCCPLYWVHRI